MEVAARNSIVPVSHAMQVARRGGSQTVTSFGSKKFCTHCEQGGHLVDQCYYLIGFPIGHKWHGKNVKPRNKKATINNIEVKRESANDSPTFTAEEYKQIMALLKNGNNQPFANATGIATPNCDNINTHSTLYWIVDSGATDHVSHVPLTHNKKGLIHDFVGLPNGEQTRIESIGSIQLSSDLSLDGLPPENLDDNPVLPIPSSLASLAEPITHPQPILPNQPSTQPNLEPPPPSDNASSLLVSPPQLSPPQPTPLKVYSRRPQSTAMIPSNPPVTTPPSPIPPTPIAPSVTTLTDVTAPPMVDPIQILHEPRHSTRLHRPPPYLQDFQTYHAAVLGPDVSSASMSGTRYPLQRYVSYSGLSSSYRSFVPYTLLVPTSEAGLTGRGIPNSVSI
ncbi:hypothetical protein SADUNF_Sadunf13G0019100 [Salix dunnii]|uniref:Lipoxygenase domain-containing protein n=1 Tax=Salix dunnii TaxID=1413687 RepID=A0A835JEY6_9ROSI|nr:hypothetical protein SADUNF_Sadunf13G0019100 [Salix dunnii]